MQSSTVLLSINNLALNFEQKVILSDIHFQLERGKVLAVVGESGSGKTQTALAIMRLLSSNATISADSLVMLENKNLLTLTEYEMQKVRGFEIGMVFQEPMNALNPVLTIGQQILEVIRRHFKITKKQAKQRVVELLTEVGLPDPARHYDEYPHQLSGGMRQRVMIAIAIAAEPKILIADEPTSALDVFTQEKILNLLKALQAKTNMAMLFITHDLLLAKKLADDVLVLKAGKVIEYASKEDFFVNPQSDYSKALIKAAETIKHEHSQLSNIKARAALLSTINLSIHFPVKKGLLKLTRGWVKAVDDINLTINQGETLAVVGQSGCGKTTLAKGILQLVKPTAGKVLFQSKNLLDIAAEELRITRRDLQVIFQDPFSSLNPRMVVGDIIAEGLISQNLMRKNEELNQRIDELLEQVGLPQDAKKRYPHEFSGGQRQRIGIARALALNPKLIICDEPTSALDVYTQNQILELLQTLQQTLDLSYLLITHNIPVAAQLAQRIAVMYQGKIIEQGATTEILNNPQQEYTKALLRAVL